MVPPPEQSSPVELAWCAGFLDGEGYFGIVKAGNGKHRHITIEAAQVRTPEPLHRLVRSLGGTISRRGGQSKTWCWKVYSATHARRILPLLIPYLSVKAEEARVVLRFAELTGQRGSGAYTAEQALIREGLERRLKELRKDPQLCLSIASH